MVGTIRFTVSSLSTLTARVYTTDGHIVLSGIPKDQEEGVLRDVTAIYSAAEVPFTTAYAISKIGEAGFIRVDEITFDCVRSHTHPVVAEADAEPAVESAVESAVEPATEPATEPEVEPEVEPATEPATEPVSQTEDDMG